MHSCSTRLTSIKGSSPAVMLPRRGDRAACVKALQSRLLKTRSPEVGPPCFVVQISQRLATKRSVEPTYSWTELGTSCIYVSS